MALSAASRRKINGGKMDGENGGMGYRGQTEEEEERERGRESEKKVREGRKRGRAGGDECAAISS